MNEIKSYEIFKEQMEVLNQNLEQLFVLFLVIQIFFMCFIMIMLIGIFHIKKIGKSEKIDEQKISHNLNLEKNQIDCQESHEDGNREK